MYKPKIRYYTEKKKTILNKVFYQQNNDNTSIIFKAIISVRVGSFRCNGITTLLYSTVRYIFYITQQEYSVRKKTKKKTIFHIIYRRLFYAAQLYFSTVEIIVFHKSRRHQTRPRRTTTTTHDVLNTFTPPPPYIKTVHNTNNN